MIGTTPKRSWAERWWTPVLVAAAAVAPFLPALRGEFVFDDRRFIVGNAFVQRPESWLRFFTDVETVDPESHGGGIVRPLRTIEFALDRMMFGLDRTAFHVHSLLWHALAAVLLLFVLRRLVGDGRIAFVAALVWAVHPAQAESVAWISSRGDVATGACVLASILFALRSGGVDRDFAISLAAAVVAPLYKETAVMVPLVIAVLRWTQRVRVPVWPYLVVSAVYLVYRQSVIIGSTSHVITFVLGGSVVGTFATMFRAFGFYLMETLVPAQSLDWYLSPSTSLADAASLGWLVVHAAIIASAIVARRRIPLWTLAVAWFYGFLVPVANWPFFLGIPTAERFLYLPLAGAAIALAAALVRAPARAWIAAGVAVAAFGVSSWQRAGQWTSDESLWNAVLADHESPRARAYSGEQLRIQGLSLRAQAANIPDGPERAAADARTAKVFERSLDDLHRALDLWYTFELSSHSKAQFSRRAEINAASVASLLGRNAEALFHAEEAIRIEGDVVPEPFYDEAFALIQLGFAPQAMAAMRQARSAGFGGIDAEIARFFLRGAAMCASDGLLDTAEEGYATALEASPEGPIRREAFAKLTALRGRDHDAAASARERDRLTDLDAALAKVVRSCPARRGLDVSK